MKDDELHSLFADDREPDPETLSKAIRSAKSSVGQTDTLMFAFVKIWVAMAELLAPMFAKLAVKNSDALNPKNNRLNATPLETDSKSGDTNA